MLKNLARWIVKYRIAILIFFGVSSIISMFFVSSVKVNYNMSQYLPDDMETKKSVEILEKEFGVTGSAQVMIYDISIPQAKIVKDKIAKIDGIKSVTWLDDVADLQKPIEYLDQNSVAPFYQENAALFQIVFEEDDYSLKTGAALDEIRTIAGDKVAIRGPAVAAKAMRDTTSSEIITIVAFVVPIFLLILFLATSSWLEPLLFITVIGISVLINMGTNVIFPSISFMTQMCAGVLQFAIAMDYSIFLLHRFAEERALGAGVEDAMRRAVYKAFSSISASSLTTVAGFVALMFMRYGIGMDMGMVLAKGILLSLICVLFLLPALAILCDKYIEKTHHRPFLPSFEKFGKVIIKLRYVIVAILLIMAIPAFRAQLSNHFLYGESSVAVSEGTKPALEEEHIKKIFGRFNPVVVMVPTGNIAKETELAKDLQHLDHIESVQALVTIADPAIARELLPTQVLDQFQSEHYNRMIINMDTEVEDQTAFETIDQISKTVQQSYGSDYVMIGSSVSVRDIKAVVDVDYQRVNLISILAVAFILLITFQSILIPGILILVIESSIWINMSVPYFFHNTLSFIGYMIVSTIQLGATIDYAILLTDRYQHNRLKMGKKEAASKAISDSGRSILTSAGILCSAGFIMGQVSSIKGISELGTLIGRGALLSGLLVFILLPQLLVILDKPIRMLTLKEGTLRRIFSGKNRKEAAANENYKVSVASIETEQSLRSNENEENEK